MSTPPPPPTAPTLEAERLINELWKKTEKEIDDIEPRKLNWKQQSLPLARIKKIMKCDEAVLVELEREQAAAAGRTSTTPTPATNQRFMIAGEAPILLSKASEMMVRELTVRAWRHTEKNRRRTLQKQDVYAAVTESDVYDFLIDIVPRVPMPTSGKQHHHGGISFVEQQQQQQHPNSMSVAAATAGAVANPGSVDFHQIQYNLLLQQQQQQQNQAQAQVTDSITSQTELQQRQMMMYMPQMQAHMQQPQMQTMNQQQQQQQLQNQQSQLMQGQQNQDMATRASPGKSMNL
mmetsp:Transcript_7384/g.11236  ORF Transcript_7384/g.11236 Transcript_7384/m.11236 type:complete len:291 (-) Transcript_7384:303-1175(-)